MPHTFGTRHFISGPPTFAKAFFTRFANFNCIVFRHRDWCS